jgi:hypothetical protein
MYSYACRCLSNLTGVALAPTHRAAASRRTQGPGGDCKAGEDNRAHQGVSAITDRQVGGDRSRINEDQAGVGPLLEPWKARGKQRHSGKHVPDADDGQEVSRVAQVPMIPMKGGRCRTPITPPSTHSVARIMVAAQ